MSNNLETKPGTSALAAWGASPQGGAISLSGQQQQVQQVAHQHAKYQAQQIPQLPHQQNGEGVNPLAALLSALSGAARANGSAQPQHDVHGGSDAHFTAQLCNALSLQPDSLLSNFQRSNAAQSVIKDTKEKGSSMDLQQQKVPTSPYAGDNTSAGACNSIEDARTEGPEQDTSSNDLGENGSSICRTGRVGSGTSQQPLTEDAKRKRRQEINRESARRVRKRKSIEHQQLQQQVNTLQAQAANAAADQVVIVRYASELTRERDGLLQRAAELEAKWVTAECQKVVLRQRIADLTGVSLAEVSETGQPLAP